MSNLNLRVDRNFPLSPKLQPDVANGDFLLCLPVFRWGTGVARESLADTPIHSGDRGHSSCQLQQ